MITGVAPTQLANPDLKWEAKEEFVLGLDYGLLGGRVFGSLDFYRNTTNNLLLEFAIPSPTLVSTQVRNAGEIRNTGLEFSLDAIPFQTDNASFDLGLTMSFNDNEILDLGGFDQIFTGTISGRGQSNQTSLLLTPGQPYPVFYGAEFTGEFNDNGFPLYNDYEDSNGDGFNDRLVGTTRCQPGRLPDHRRPASGRDVRSSPRLPVQGLFPRGPSYAASRAASSSTTPRSSTPRRATRSQASAPFRATSAPRRTRARRPSTPTGSSRTPRSCASTSSRSSTPSRRASSAALWAPTSARPASSLRVATCS